MKSSLRLRVALAAFAVITAGSFAIGQVNNPGVTQRGAVVKGNAVSWFGTNQIQDAGSPPGVGTVNSISATSAGSTITIGGSASPCAGPACAFTFELPNVVAAGSVGTATQAPQITFDAQGRATAAANVLITPAIASVTGLGTGVAAALAVNVGNNGAFITRAGDAGTPSSLTLTNATGLPLATGIAGFGTNWITTLGANLPTCAADGAHAYTNAGGAAMTCTAITAGSGDVVGPASATDTAIARYDGATGKLIQNSGVTIDGSNNIAGAAGISGTSVTVTGAASAGTVAGAAVATQANQEAATATNLIVTPGRQQFHPAHPKVWLRCTASGTTYTQQAAYGVSGSTCGSRTGVGRITVTFSTAFSNANTFGCTGASMDGAPVVVEFTAPSTTTIGVILTTTNTGTDLDIGFFMTCFGDQ